MIDYTITITRDGFQRFIANMPAIIGPAVYAAMQDIERESKIACPVDTGRLRGSIHSVMTGDFTGVVGTDVEYSFPVHEGHSTVTGGYVAGRPFLLAPALGSGPIFVKRIKQSMASAGIF